MCTPQLMFYTKTRDHANTTIKKIQERKKIQTNLELQILGSKIHSANLAFSPELQSVDTPFLAPEINSTKKNVGAS